MSVKNGRRHNDDDFDFSEKDKKGKERKQGVSLDFELQSMRFDKNMSAREKAELI